MMAHPLTKIRKIAEYNACGKKKCQHQPCKTYQRIITLAKSQKA